MFFAQSLSPLWSRAFLVLLSLYALSLLTSMAAMELLSWSLVVVSLLSWVRFPIKELLLRLKIGPDLALGVFGLAVLMSGIFSPSPDAVWWKVAGQARWIVILYALSWAWRQVPQRHWPHLLRWFFGLTFLIGLYAVAQFVWGVEFTRSRQLLHEFARVGDHSYYRASGFFNLCLTFAYSIGMVGFLAAGFLWRTPFREWKNPANRWALLASLGALMGCVASVSRGSWVAIAVTSVVVLLLANRKRLIHFGVLGFSTVLALALSNEVIRSRMLSIVDLQDRSNWLRTAIWHANWEMFLDHPWFGVGIGLNGELSKPYFARLGYEGVDVFSHAHNNFLNMLSCTGLFGFLAFVAFSYFFLHQSYRLFKNFRSRGEVFFEKLALGTFGAQVFLHVGGMTECNFTDGEVNHMLMMVWGLVVALSALAKRPA